MKYFWKYIAFIVNIIVWTFNILYRGIYNSRSQIRFNYMFWMYYTLNLVNQGYAQLHSNDLPKAFHLIEEIWQKSSRGLKLCIKAIAVVILTILIILVLNMYINMNNFFLPWQVNSWHKTHKYKNTGVKFHLPRITVDIKFQN